MAGAAAALLDGTGLPPELNENILHHLGTRLDMDQVLILCGISRSARQAISVSSLALRFSRKVLGAGYGRWMTLLQLIAERCPAAFQLEFSSCDIDSVAATYLRSGTFPALTSLRLLRCYHLKAPYDDDDNISKLAVVSRDTALRPEIIEAHAVPQLPGQQAPQEQFKAQKMVEAQKIQLHELVALNLNVLDHAGFSLQHVHTLAMTGCESSMDGAQTDGFLNLLEHQAPRLRHLFLGGAKLQLYSVGRELCVPQIELCELTFWDDEVKLQASSFLPNAKIVDFTNLKTLKAVDGTYADDITLPWDCAVECRGRRGVRPLHLAAIAGDGEAVSWLLSVGADCNAKDAKGCTALFRACQHGSTKATKQLLDAGADYLLQNQSLETPLYIASLCGFFGCVEALLAADSGRREHKLTEFNYFDGWTPLHAACLKGSYEIAEALLHAGFDANALNKWRQAPMHVVARSGDISLAELLYSYPGTSPISGSNTDPPGRSVSSVDERSVIVADAVDAISAGAVKGARIAQQTVAARNGTELNRADVDDLTPARIAQDRGHHEMLAWLAERGATIPTANERGKRKGRRRKKNRGASAQGGGAVQPNDAQARPWRRDQPCGGS
ncbi:ankyrin repeat domain-containing protein [bacterium]|nr:ankyrin repeat domain-containing protein [bacterium]